MDFKLLNRSNLTAHQNLVVQQQQEGTVDVFSQLMDSDLSPELVW